MNSDKSCPKCGAEELRSWDELSDDQREVVRRLPGAVDYEASERQSTHRWCTRCWYEATSGSEVSA